MSALTAWWEGLITLQRVLVAIAVPATIVLFLQTLLQILGVSFGGGDIDIDADVDADFDVDADLEADADAGSGKDHSLRLFTVQGLIIFLAVGGWSGVALLNTSLSPVVSIIIAVIAGETALLIVAWMIYLVMNMQASGNLDMKKAVGLIGQVYTTINPNSGVAGKVVLTVDNRYTEASAITEGDTPIKTGETVKIIKLTEDNTLVVEPISVRRGDSGEI